MMGQRRKLVLGVAAMLALPGVALAGGLRKVRIVTSHLPGLVHETGEPGALQELVSELCRRAGLAPHTSYVPWPRALFLARKTPATAIYPLTRLPEREREFRWIVPIYEETFVLLAPQGKLAAIEEMKERRIALLRGAAQAQLLRELGFKHLVEASSIDEVHRFLLGGMADAAFGERRIVAASLKGHAAREGEFEISAPLRSTTAWLAGSPDFSDSDLTLLQRAWEAMRTDGSHRRILTQHKLA